MSHDPVDILIAMHALEERAESWFRLAMAMTVIATLNGCLATWALVRLFGGAA